MPLPARILTQTIFQCPKEECFYYFASVEATFTHVCKIHPTFGGIGGDMANEQAIIPATVYDNQLSTIHICRRCSQLLPSIDCAETHLRSTAVHQAQVIRFNAAQGLHQLLPSVALQRQEMNLDSPPIRVVFQQSNWIYGDNRIVNIVNESGAQIPGNDCSFPSVTLTNPDEEDVITRWTRVPSIHPVVIYEQKNHILGDNAHLTILNGPPAWPMFAAHPEATFERAMIHPDATLERGMSYSYEQNNHIYGANTIVNIASGPYGNEDKIEYLQNNYLHGKTHLLNGNNNIHVNLHRGGFLAG